jgi:hypothetical protein
MLSVPKLCDVDERMINTYGASERKLAGETEELGKPLASVLFVYKSCMTWPRTESGPPRSKAGN